MSDKELALAPSEIEQNLIKVSGWQLVDKQIQKEFGFSDFVETMEFVNQVADLAQAENHHPLITINYNQVKLILSTHSVNGLSNKDFTLASKVDQLV